MKSDETERERNRWPPASRLSRVKSYALAGRSNRSPIQPPTIRTGASRFKSVRGPDLQVESREARHTRARVTPHPIAR